MKPMPFWIATASLLFFLSGEGLAQAPEIDDLSDDSRTRSGRLRIFGSDFGERRGPRDTSHKVLIDGLSPAGKCASSMNVQNGDPSL